MTSSTLSTQAPGRSRPLPLPLPPAGPAWYSSVMGTGILATLLQVNADSGPLGRRAAAVLLVVGWVLLLGLTGAFLIRVGRDRGAFTSTVVDSSVQPLWGTVAMALLSIGAATLTVTASRSPQWSPVAVVVDAVLWGLGTSIGILTALGFAAVLIKRGAGAPTPIWGLPIVPPMVSATTGAALVPHVASSEGRFVLLVAAVACFFLALSLGVVVFAVAYHHHWRVAPVPLAASASVWIPLGIVGQSTAAAQALVAQAAPFLQDTATRSAHVLADAYGYVMLAAGVPMVTYAVVVTARGFARRMPFTPGWWALTFPVGTLSLGAHLLGQASGHRAIEAAGGLALGVLVCTWSLSAMATLAALRARVSSVGVAAIRPQP